MRPFYLRLGTIIFIALTLSITPRAFSQVSPQQLKIRNFAVFGGFQTTSNPAFYVDSINYGVNINPSGRVNGGALGSYTFVTTGFNVNLNSNIYSGHRVYFDTANNITGNVTAGINGKQNLNVITALSLTNFGGETSNGFFQAELNANGNVYINPDVSNIGTVRLPSGSIYNGPSPENGVLNNPVFPQLPVLPTNVTWGAPGEGSNIFGTTSITPGTYGSIVMAGQQTITFNGPGRYIFDSIKSNSASQNVFVFDFKNNETGIFGIYINKNADLRNIRVVLLNGGSASRIYTEVHGTGINNGYAFSIDGGPSTNASNWEGTVWTPSSKIRIGLPGSSTSSVAVVNGCLWSGQMVRLFGQATVNYIPLSINADPAQTPLSPIIPYYFPPANGKVNKKIGSELQSLYENYNPLLIAPNDFIFRVDKTTNKVLIEVITIVGKTASVINRLVNQYGFTDIISNGEGSLIVTGKIPIANLTKLNTDPISADIDYCRPLFLPLTNSGLVTTLGDSAMNAGLVRRGYDLTGAGVKVGVISDSYNKALPDPFSTTAANDLGNDLPASIDLLLDYPFGAASDEGRAMMQIVHDVAPAAALAFRTGFISAGDMAEGINELANDCNIIVDDVTFITEPFFKDGTIAKAVNQAVNVRNVSYFSAAGNFSNKAYDGTFEGIDPPAGINGLAHDFGGGNFLQPIKLQPGSYTIVLQWVDDIYSLGETAGTANDLDIYLVDDQGTVLFGFNRVNTGADPLEVLPFRVNGNVPLNANLMVVRADGSTAGLKFKYIVFRGGFSFLNYGGAPTLVGQANSTGAIAVGAVAYDQTPPFGVTPATIEAFSSLGGALVNGAIRLKPDLTAPDKGNITVNIGPDTDNDNRPNFLGTSAAAPHAAAVAALIREGKQKFSSANITPTALKNLLKATATDIGTPGNDRLTGAGLVNADAAMRTFANPEPFIGTLSVVEPGITPGSAPFTVSVKGSNLSSTTVIYFNDNPITTAFINSREVRGAIPAFSGNPPIQLYTPPISSSGLDGGYSAKRFFNEQVKKNIVITVNDKTKKFGEILPAFTSTITVDGIALASSGLTLTDLKLNNLSYSTTATPGSEIGLYPINITNPIDPNNAGDQVLLAKYNYQFIGGILQVLRLPLKITPIDKTINYGNYLGEVTFNYIFDKTRIADAAATEEIIRAQHKKFLAENALAVLNGFKLPQANGSALTNADLLNMSTIASFQSVKNARKFVDRDGQLIPLTTPLNNDDIGLQRFLVDVSAKSVYNYKLNSLSSPLVTAFPGEHSRLLLNAKALANGSATAQMTNGQLRAIVNGQLLAIVNGQLRAIVNGQLLAIVNGELSVLENVEVLSNGQLKAIVNGVSVTIPNGQLQALVNGELFFIANPVVVNGQLQAIVNGQLLAIVNGQLKAIVNGQLLPIVNGQLQAIVNGQLLAIVNGQLLAIVNGQLLAIVNGELVLVTELSIVNGQLLGIVNGQLKAIVNGQLKALVNGEVSNVENVSLVNGQLRAIVNGQLLGLVNGQLRAIVNGQLQPIVNANNLGGVNSNNNTAVIVDQDDVNLQAGSIGAMFSINMITGLEVGNQMLVPGAFGQENFDVTYGLGKVTILAATDYYTKATGNLHNVLTWGANTDGSGSNPANFGLGKTFHLANRSTAYLMTANWTVGGRIEIPAGAQLRLNGYSLSEAALIGTGTLYGSQTSNLSVTGVGAAGPLNFANGGGNLNNLTLNRTGTSPSAVVGTALNVYGVLTVTSGALNLANKVTLKSTATNTARVAPITTGSILGNATVERFIPARRAWRIMSAPVGGSQSINAAWQEGATTSSANPNPKPGFGTHITEGSAASGFDHNPLTSLGSIKKYFSASDTWVPLDNTNATAVNNNAYLLFVRGDRGIQLSSNSAPPNNTILRSTGPLKTGDQTFPVSATGFTAIPNPYASPIDFNKLTRNNVQNNFYLWDPKLGGEFGVGGYVLVSYNGNGGYDITPSPVSPESQFIQSGQGFMVHSTGAAGSLVIKESDKTGGAATNVFRSSNNTKGLRTSLQTSNKEETAMLDETFSSYGSTFSDRIDNMDAIKLPNLNENLGIMRNGQAFMIERRENIAENDTIQFKLWNTSAKEYILRFTPVNLSSSTVVTAYLEDKYLNTSTAVDLVEETKVSFSVNADAASANPNRFRVVLSSGKTMPKEIDFTKGVFKISPNPLTGKAINLQFIDQPKGTYNIELMNNMGQVVYRSQVMHGGGTATQTLQLNSRIAKGAYQMQIVNKLNNTRSVIPVLSN